MSKKVKRTKKHPDPQPEDFFSVRRNVPLPLKRARAAAVKLATEAQEAQRAAEALATEVAAEAPAAREAAAAAAPPPRQVFITIVTDVVEALIQEGVDDTTFLFDNNKSHGSQHLGTNHLDSHLRVGDDVFWFISGLEVETWLEIKSVTGPGAEVCGARRMEGLFGPFWQGKVGEKTGRFPYKLELAIENRLMALSSAPALTVS
jgi:uncharacterized protein (DUF4415 family)